MKQRRGFTLIELLVVIAIIGLLATLAVVALNNARSKSRDAKRVSDIKQIQTALELFYLDQNGYPDDSGTLGATSGLHCLDSDGFDTQGNCSDPYMGVIPANPEPNGSPYMYTGTASLAEYIITFNLENKTGGLGSGDHSATQDGID